MIRFHYIFVFVLLLALQNSLAYVQPIHIRYSDEQLKALQDNPKPVRVDAPPRELIDNPYGAQIYYDEVLPHENEVVRIPESKNESPIKKTEHGYYNLNSPNSYNGNIHNKNCKNPNNCNIPTTSQGAPGYNHWNYPYNNSPFSSMPSESESPSAGHNEDINYDYIIYIQQYQEYLKELVYDFYLQRQMLLEVINQQEQQLNQLRGQYNQLGSAISNTEYQMYQMQSASNHQIPPSSSSSSSSSSVSGKFQKGIGNNQQAISSDSSTVAGAASTSYTNSDGGVHYARKPFDMTKENQQMPIEN